MTPFAEVDNQQVEVGLVVAADPMQRVGFLAFQVPNRRGVKTGVEAELRRMLRDEFGLALLLEPVVPIDAVEAAIEQNGLGAVSFRKLNNPAGLFDADDDWWTDGDELGGVELKLSPRRSARLLGRKLATFIRTLNNDLEEGEEPVGFPELATIDEHTYDELAVEVYISGRKKVMRVNADGHTMSHAFSWDLELGPGASPEAVVSSLVDLLPQGVS